LKTRVGFVALKLTDGVFNRHKRMVLATVLRVNRSSEAPINDLMVAPQPASTADGADGQARPA